MKQVDKVHVVIGIKEAHFSPRQRSQDLEYLKSTLQIQTGEAQRILRRFETEYQSSRDFKAKVKMSYEQLGRYVAKGVFVAQRDYWVWPDVIEIEKPPIKDKIIDITEGCKSL